MLTLLGSLLGFISSAFPELLKIWQNKQGYAHELEILDRRIEQLRLGYTQLLTELEVKASNDQYLGLLKHDGQPSGVTWVDGLRASVRPVITYAFFLLFTTVKISTLSILVIDKGMAIVVALPQIWDPETQALFAAVISFWFGQRATSNRRLN